MKNIEKLKNDRAAALASADALLGKVDTEQRAMTAEEQKEFDGYVTTADNLQATIDRAEQTEKRKPAAPETRGAGLETTQPAKVHDNAEDRPWHPAGNTNQAALGAFMLAVKSAGAHGMQASEIDPRLRKLDVRNPEVRAASGLNEAVLEDGGFLVMQEQGALIEKDAFDTGVISRRVTRIPLTNPSSNGIKLPYVDETSRANGSRWGGIRVYWADEGEEKTASKPKLGRIELSLKKVVGLFYITDELAQDSGAMGTIANRGFREELGFALDDAIIRGTGAGQPLGILNAPATISVPKESGQAAATVVFANINKMWDRLPPRSKSQAAWFMNQEVEKELRKMFIPFTNVAGTENVGGSAVFMPPGGVSGSPYGTIFGRPAIPIEQAEALGTVGDIILMDPTQYLMIEKGGIQTASSIHVRFIYDEQVFRFVMRVDGQPGWKSPLTPYKGTATLSPFVTLATRA